MRGLKRQTPLLELQYLTPDLWREVLLRLPAETLLRFRCVCKTWCSFIDSPNFISLHHKIYKNNSANTFLLAAEHIPKTFFDFNFTIRRSDTIRKTGQVVKFTYYSMFMCGDMIDGLLLMDCSDPNHDKPRELSIWNPSIRRSVLLLPCSLDSSNLWNPCFVRSFHLGFDYTSNDYKVLGLQLGDYRDSELMIEIAIYSLRDHGWRAKPNWINVPRNWFGLVKSRYGAVFCQGTLYWRPFYRFFGDGDGDEEHTHVLSFDFDSEEFCFVKMPDIRGDMLRFIFLLGGSLALLGISRVRSCVWVMDKNARKELWHQFSSGDSTLDAYKFLDDCGNHNLQIMYIENSGMLLIHNRKKLMYYNIMGHQIQQIRNFRCSNLVTYAESLVLHKGYEAATSTTLT